MAKDKFNPYNSEQYFNLPKPPPIYNPEQTLTSRADMSFADVQKQRLLKQKAEEIAIENGMRINLEAIINQAVELLRLQY